MFATRGIDYSYRVFDKARSELVAALASDALLRRFNELAYGASEAYRADTNQFRTYLFPWEERVVADFFPPAPARILVGGAGGGREVFALARMGYRVLAFEPSASLVATLAATTPEGCDVEPHRAGYEDLLQPLGGQSGPLATRLQELAPFDASIIGWGSFSHLMRDEERVGTLSFFRAVTKGPIIVSFLMLRTPGADAGGKLAALRSRLPRRPERSTDDLFSPYIGYYHSVDQQEVERLASAAGLTVAYLNFDERETNWPHAVLSAAEADVSTG